MCEKYRYVWKSKDMSEKVNICLKSTVKICLKSKYLSEKNNICQKKVK